MVCTATGNNDNFLNTRGQTLLIQYSPQRTLNIGLFVIGHNTYAASNVLVSLLLLPSHLQ